jgi:ketosteroid isomerase-like protein
MSHANVELVVASNDAYNAGDIDAAMSFYAPNVEALPDASVFPEAGPLHGREDFRRWTEEIGTAWVNVQFVAREVLAVGDDHVLLRGDWGGEGAASGIETTSSITAVFTVRDGLISRVEYFFDHDKALKAVGLKA